MVFCRWDSPTGNQLQFQVGFVGGFGMWFAEVVLDHKPPTGNHLHGGFLQVVLVLVLVFCR